jgi:hypothetical protein
MIQFAYGLILTLALSVPRSGHAGGSDVGNGGDFVRAAFMRIGAEVIHHLMTATEGQKLVTRENLDLKLLAATLSTDRIFVLSEKKFSFIDNKGASVDALVVNYSELGQENAPLFVHPMGPSANPPVLALRRESWERALRTPFNVHMLVFHEMLRLTYWEGAYPVMVLTERLADEDYVISRQLSDWIALELKTPTFHPETGMPLMLADDPLTELTLGTTIRALSELNLFLDPSTQQYFPARDLVFRSGRASCDLRAVDLYHIPRPGFMPPLVVSLNKGDEFQVISVSVKENPFRSNPFDTVEVMAVGEGLPALRIRCTNQALNQDKTPRAFTVAHFNRAFKERFLIEVED